MPEPVLARCGSCGKTWRVPSAEKVYRCKGCGGRVSTAAPAAEDEPAAAPAEAARAKPGKDCTACRAVNAEDARFCEECGASLVQSPTRLRGGDAVEREEISADLRRARRAIGVVRYLYVLCAMTAAGWVAILLRFLSTVPGDPDALYLWIGFSTLVAVLYVAGAVEVSRSPFFWSVLLAAVSTLELGYRLLEDPGSWVTRIRTGVVVILWIAAAVVFPVARIVREHPEFYLARWVQGRRLARVEDGPPPAFEPRRLLRWLGAAVVAVALACAIHRSTRLPSCRSAADAFAAAWNGEDLAGVSVHFTADARERMRNNLEKLVARQDWNEHPEAEFASLAYTTQDAAEVYFRTPAGALRTIWRYAEGRWVLRGFELPD